MIDSILELVLENVFEATILIVAGLLLGVLISLLYWRGQVNKREGQIKDLETSVEEKDAGLKEMRVRAQDLIKEREERIELLNTQLKDRETLLDEREKMLELLNAQLGQREENIRDLTQQISEKDESIDVLKDEAVDLDKKNQNSVTRAEAAEARVEELEKSLEEKEQESTSLKARMHAMQDDLTLILGIGPKVSSILRMAGINTFEKLASADVNRIRKILEDENPNLLRLTDPSSWPEQARMASEETWEVLWALQRSLKESRRV